MVYISKDDLAHICARHNVRELSLFGSALESGSRPDSDIDLIVDFEPSATVGFLALGHLREDLEGLFGRKVDLVTKQGLNDLIRDEVLSRARVIFEP